MPEAGLARPAARPGARRDLKGLERIGDIALWATIFSGSIVMFEPAPYDLLLTVMAVFGFVAGLKIPRAIGPFIILLLLYNVGGILASTQVVFVPEKAPTFVAVSLFLAFTAIYLAATIAEHPRRVDVIMRAYVISAVIGAAIGVLGYLGHIDMLTLYGRAKGLFKDPNVYGPFLILPLAWLTHDALTRPVSQLWRPAIPLAIVFLGMLLSFSRATWGLALYSMLAVALVVFANEKRPAERLKMSLYVALGAVALVLFLAVILSIPEIQSLFTERAKLVQDYDGAKLGRFARHLIGFGWAMELPLGQGPLQFGYLMTEDPHNVYLKSFMAYGWIGGISYPVLAAWTIAKSFPLMFKPRPWQAAAQCVWIVLFGHQVMSWIIDSDHWRHCFVLWGMAWGMIALEAQWQRDRARQGGAPASAAAGRLAPAA